MEDQDNYTNETGSLLPGGDDGGIAAGMDNSMPFLESIPYILAYITSIYSPVIVFVGVFILSFYNQNIKGGIYLFWALVASVIRFFTIRWFPTKEMNNPNCKVDIRIPFGSGKMTSFKIDTFSTFFITFSMIYVCGPMFIYKDYNLGIIIWYAFILIFDLVYRSFMKCIDVQLAIADIILGLLTGIIVILILLFSNSQGALFYNETSNKTEMCMKPSKQTFKCKVPDTVNK